MALLRIDDRSSASMCADACGAREIERDRRKALDCFNWQLCFHQSTHPPHLRNIMSTQNKKRTVADLGVLEQGVDERHRSLARLPLQRTEEGLRESRRRGHIATGWKLLV